MPPPPTEPSMVRLLALLREFGALEKARASDGLTTHQFERWNHLKQILGRHIPQGEAPPGSERRQHFRLPTRLLVQVRSRDQLQDALVTNISRGGLFISTAFPAPIGTKFTVCIRVAETGDDIELPCEVVSMNVDPELSSAAMGMGMRFANLDDAQRRVVDEMFNLAIEHVATEPGVESAG